MITKLIILNSAYSCIVPLRGMRGGTANIAVVPAKAARSRGPISPVLVALFGRSEKRRPDRPPQFTHAAPSGSPRSRGRPILRHPALLAGMGKTVVQGAAQAFDQFVDLGLVDDQRRAHRN